MKDSILNKTLSAIHVIFFSSILTFGIIFLSLTLLTVPAVCAFFMIGKELIYKEYDITDSLVKKYFSYFKESFKLGRYIPISLIALLNMAGVAAGARLEMITVSVVCLVFSSLLFTVILYLAGYYTFVSKEVTLPEAAICMMYKPGFLIPVIVIMILLLFFFRALIAEILFFVGALPLFVIEVVIMLHTLHYRRLRGMLGDDKMAYLVTGEKQDSKIDSSEVQL